MTLDIQDIYIELLPVTHALGADVDEAFLAAKADGFSGSAAEFLDYVRAEADKWYVSLGPVPTWVQEPDWQYWDGQPMVFVGEIKRSALESGLHDDAVFYVFWDRESGITETVIQVG